METSIYEALVNLANFDLLIERQGNFGNSLTGDRAAVSDISNVEYYLLQRRFLQPRINNFY